LVEAERSDRLRLVVDGLAPPAAVGARVRLHAEVEGEEVSWEIASDGRPFSVAADTAVTAGPHDVSLWTDPVWRPADLGLSIDARTLGVAVSRVAIETARVPRRLPRIRWPRVRRDGPSP
jgi:hypothetical protein